MKKRVLMVSCNGLGNGGVQHIMMDIVRNTSDEYAFDMLLFTNERRYFDDEAEKYATIYRIPNKKTPFDYYIRFIRILKGTYKILKKGNYDAIHCNNDYESGICLLAARLAKTKKRIVHSHMIYDCNSGNFVVRIINRIYKLMLNKCSTDRIACSKNAGNSLYTKPFDVLFNSVDLSRFTIEKRSEEARNTINFIHVGYFSDVKNQTFIVKVLSELKKSISNISLTLIGWGDAYKKHITDTVEKYDMTDNVTILPSDSDVSKVLSTSDYMIFPSKAEGFGIVLIEAQAMGVYCFASTGVPAEANAGMCDFLELKDGPQAWAEHIINHIKNGQKISRAERIDDYSLETYIKKIKNIYG